MVRAIVRLQRAARATPAPRDEALAVLAAALLYRRPWDERPDLRDRAAALASLPASDGDMLNECDIRPIATGGVQLHAPGCRSWNEAQDERALRWLEIVEADSRADAIARFRAMSYRERDLLRRCAASMEVVNGVPLSHTRAAPSSDGPAPKEERDV